MHLYILHYAAIDAEGHLSIDCQGPFKTKEEAQQQQATLLLDFQNERQTMSNALIEERCGCFQRIAYKEQPAEIQTHIEEIMI